MTTRPPSKGQVQAALHAFALTCRPTENELAERRAAALARVIAAKSNFSRVAVNFLKDEFTEEQVTAAVRDLEAARQALRALLGQPEDITP